jgi:hypothetical protein
MPQVLRWMALAVLFKSSLGVGTANVQAQDATET